MVNVTSRLWIPPHFDDMSFFGGVCSGVTIWPPAFGVFKRGGVHFRIVEGGGKGWLLDPCKHRSGIRGPRGPVCFGGGPEAKKGPGEGGGGGPRPLDYRYLRGDGTGRGGKDWKFE